MLAGGQDLLLKSGFASVWMGLFFAAGCCTVKKLKSKLALNSPELRSLIILYQFMQP